MHDIEATLLSNIRSAWRNDRYTAQHCRNVSRMVWRLGSFIGQEERTALRLAGFLHDLGKLSIPRSVLYKTGPLTKHEWLLLQSHPETGAWLAEMAGAGSEIVLAIRQHHERLDGSGYPAGLHGSDITYLARLIAVADVYCAMTSDRPYRPALPHSTALEFLSREALFDQELVSALKALLTKPVP